jgi:hypothetical protein
MQFIQINIRKLHNYLNLISSVPFLPVPAIFLDTLEDNLNRECSFTEGKEVFFLILKKLLDDNKVAPPTLPNTKAFKWLSIKSRVKGFLRVSIDIILDWFF